MSIKSGIEVNKKHVENVDASRGKEVEIGLSQLQRKGLSKEIREELQKISNKKFLSYSREERFRFITNGNLNYNDVKAGDEIVTTFTFDGNGKPNSDLYLLTTAGQVLPEQVREVKVGGETYNRVGLNGEFFSSKNKRLTIHEGTKIIASKVEDVSKMLSENKKQTELYIKSNPGNTSSTDLIKTSIDKGIDPSLAVLVFGEYLENVNDESERKVKIEELLTKVHRLRGTIKDWDAKIGEDGKYPTEFVLRLLKTYNKDWKKVANDYGIDDVKLEEEEKKISFDFSTLNIGNGDKGLLDFISYAEGTNGNYNAIFGNGSQNSLKFTNMNLGEILSFQQDYKRKLGSAAIGKYQFMDYTLKDMIKRYGFSMEERFTPDFQDKLAYIKLQERGLDDYKIGDIGRDDFQLALSKEWASIAKDDSGLSYYHGDSMNNRATKVGKSIGEFLDKVYA